MKGLGDAQIFILRNIVISATGIVGDLFFDFGRNLLHAVGLDAMPHVYHFGVFQLIVLAFFALSLAVSLNDLRYYSDFDVWKEVGIKK